MKPCYAKESKKAVKKDKKIIGYNIIRTFYDKNDKAINKETLFFVPIN